MGTTKVKAQFFAQYLFQEVYCNNYRPKSEKLSVNLILLPSTLNSGYLLLRSIEQLTDEEYVTAAKLIYGLSFKAVDGWFVERDIELGFITVKSKKSHHSYDIDFKTGGIDMYDDNEKSDMPLDHYNACDYFRDIGILLPFTVVIDGQPETYSPEKLIELGWAKIKKD